MKKQSGFTLIELLLVLAIIGIISAIAIPALLGQRARARDKASVANLDSVIADGIGIWDKAREGGSSAGAAMTLVINNLTAQHTSDHNPWNATSPAYGWAAMAAGANATTSAFLTACAVSSLGQVHMYTQAPSGTTGGFIGGAVLLQNNYNNSTTYKKGAAVE
jgi:prepilin-type N-terminal cleavage/methylation domain-containing protein